MRVWVGRTESLNTRATCFMVWPSPPALCVGTNGRMANVCRVFNDNTPTTLQPYNPNPDPNLASLAK